MDARQFIKSYQVSGKDWMKDKEDVLVKLLSEYVAILPKTNKT